MATDDHKITLLKPAEVDAYGVSLDPKADGYCATCWMPVAKQSRGYRHRAPVVSRRLT